MDYVAKLGFHALVLIAAAGSASATTYRYDIISSMKSAPAYSWEKPGEFKMLNRFELDVSKLEQEMPPQWSRLSVTLYFIAYGWNYSFYAAKGVALPGFSKTYDSHYDNERWLVWDQGDDYSNFSETLYARVDFDRNYNIVDLAIDINSDNQMNFGWPVGGSYSNRYCREYQYISFPEYCVFGEVSRTVTRTTISTELPTEPDVVAPVPLPGSLAFLLTGMLGLAAARSSRVSHFN